jgi:phenylacetic acid degradation operon negative regulatory protein
MGIPPPSPALRGLRSPAAKALQRPETWASGALLAGFDAGQTHTTCRLADRQSGAILAEGEGPGVSHLAAAEGRQRFAAALGQSLEAARQALPADRRQDFLAAAAVGASGIEAGSAVQQEGLDLAAEALALPVQRLVVTGDERTALRGAFPDGPGLVVISDGQGRHHRCAGWGWLLDGAGSTMDIGRDALALSLRMADGREPEGPLREAIWQVLGLDPQDPAAPQRIKALVVDPAFGAAGFARLAPELNRLAEGGDLSARPWWRWWPPWPRPWICGNHRWRPSGAGSSIWQGCATASSGACGGGGGSWWPPGGMHAMAPSSWRPLSCSLIRMSTRLRLWRSDSPGAPGCPA